MKINEIFSFEKGSLQSSKCISGKYNFITASMDWKSHKEYTHDTEAIIVAVAASGSLGRVHYVKGKFISSDLCYILTPKDQKKYPVDLNFYFHIFNIIREDLVQKTATGTSKLSINKSNFGNYEIPYFDIDHQKKHKSKLIALENYSNLLNEKSNFQSVTLNNLRRAVLRDVLNSATTLIALDDLCNFTKGVSPLQKTQPGKYPLVATSEERKTSSQFQFDCDAVCIPLVSSTGHGKKTLNKVHFQNGKFALGTILVALTSKDKNLINMRFLHQFLFLNKDDILVPLMKGMANVTLPIGELKKISIPLPKIEEQERFEGLMQKMEKLENNIQENIKNCDLLLQSVLKEIFV